jgi:molybdenum cofactor cytidylyltransferase
MKFGPVPLELAEGKILGHNIAGPDGRRALRKGRPLTASDLVTLRELGHSSAYVAELEPGDVDEDRAARRVAEALAGAGLRLTGSASGRVNLLSSVLGVLRVDALRLARLNACDGLTVATLGSTSVLRPGQMAATVKVLPYAVPEGVLQEAEAVASSGGPLLQLTPLSPRKVGLLLSGSKASRGKLEADFAPLVERVRALGSEVALRDYVALSKETPEEALAAAIRRQCESGAEIILLAGETAVMDPRDITPRAIELAGGRIECVGAPVDPGNLLVLGYRGERHAVAILAAPGCARSRKTNVIDWVLPRLLVGERLRRADLVALGHGGLLEDVPERPMRREAPNP